MLSMLSLSIRRTNNSEHVYLNKLIIYFTIVDKIFTREIEIEIEIKWVKLNKLKIL